MAGTPRRRRNVVPLIKVLRASTALLAAALVSVPIARAGGDFVDLAVGAKRVWFVGPPGVRSLAVRTGRTLAAPELTGAPYPLSVTLAGGAAWVASVENGFVYGTLSRIDERSGKVRVVWRRPDSSVQYVAVGAGGVWALIGLQGVPEIALFTVQGRLARTWQIPDAGRMAADGSGCWISTNEWLLHIDPAGRVHRVVRAQLGDVATGAGAVWLPGTASVLRVDERTGCTRTLSTGRLGLGGFQHDLAAGDDALWALRYVSRTSSALVRFDIRTGKATGRVSLPGIADAVVVRPGAIWVATVPGYSVIRIDPRTLRRAFLVTIP